MLFSSKILSAGLEFSGETCDVYFSFLVVPEMRCGEFCDSPCWPIIDIQPTWLSLSEKYGGPGPCTYCGCCLEAVIAAGGIIGVTLFVNPETGKPLSKYLGGIPIVGNAIPNSSILKLNNGSGVDACINSNVGNGKLYSFAFLTIGTETVFLSQQRPICGFGLSINSTYLIHGSAEVSTAICMGGNNCTWARSWINLNNVSVWIPVDSLFPSKIERSSAHQSNKMISIKNLTTQQWNDLNIKLYDLQGNVTDSLYLPVIDGLNKLNWIVKGTNDNNCLSFIAYTDSSTIHPIRKPELTTYFFKSPLSPYFLIEDYTGKGALIDLVKHTGSNYSRCRPGKIEVDLNSSIETGYSIEKLDVKLNISDEFEDSELYSLWTIENPSAPQSYVSLTERPGYLRIVATESGDGALFETSTNYRAPRIFQNVSGDWVLETKIDFLPTDNFEAAGIFMNGQCIASRCYVPSAGGQLVYTLGHYQPYDGSVTYFRIEKMADTLTGYWSKDGENWNGNHKIYEQPEYVGLIVLRKNWERGGEHNSIADFDYFRMSSIQTSVKEITKSISGKYIIMQNYPNPFNPETNISYHLMEAANVKIEIFNIRGQILKTLVNERQRAGSYSVLWDAREDDGKLIANGVYLCRFMTENYLKTIKLTLLR